MTHDGAAGRRATPDARRRNLPGEEIVALVDHLPARIGYWDRDWRNVFCNRAFATWFGLTPDEVVGRRIGDLTNPEFLDLMQPYLDRAQDGEGGQFEVTATDATGDRRHVSSILVPHLVDGEVVGVYTLGIDLTERVAAEESARDYAREVAALTERERISGQLHAEVMQLLYAALLTLEAQTPWAQRQRGTVRILQHAIRDLRSVTTGSAGTRRAGLTPWTAAELVAVLDRIPAVVAFLDNDLHVRFTNATANRWFGHSRTESIGIDGRSFLGEELFELNLPYMKDALAGHEQSFVRTLRSADGQERVVQLHYIPNVAPGEVDGFFVLGLEVTELVRAESALRDTAEQLAVLDDRQRIAADIHDLVVQRLFGAGIAAERVREAVPAALRPQLDEIVDDIDGAIQQLRDSIVSLRQATGTVHLGAEIDRAVRHAERSLGFPPTLNLTGDLDRVSPAVAHELVPVLMEALSNAVRHANATHVVVTLTVGHRLTLTVSDDGCGIPSAPDRDSGLSTMRARARTLGGTCSVTAREPSGTTVTWSVPLD